MSHYDSFPSPPLRAQDEPFLRLRLVALGSSGATVGRACCAALETTARFGAADFARVATDHITTGTSAAGGAARAAYRIGAANLGSRAGELATGCGQDTGRPSEAEVSYYGPAHRSSDELERSSSGDGAGNNSRYVVKKRAHFIPPIVTPAPSRATAKIASLPTATSLAITPSSPIKKATGVAKIPYSFESFHFS
jgi:hypothetical protein